MKKIAIVTLLICSFFAGYLISQKSTERKIQTLTLEKDKYKGMIDAMQQCPKKDCKEELRLTIEKEKSLEDVIESKISFVSRTKRFSSTKTVVTVTMVGGQGMKVDASDLVFLYSKNLKIGAITPGTAFPLYPRMVAEDGILTITGIATIGSGEIIMGKPNEIYVEFEVEKIGDATEKGTITLDTVNTNAFLQSNSVLDEGRKNEVIEI